MRRSAEGFAATVRDGEPSVILRAEGLAYSYANIDVWSQVSFALREGEVAFLVGPNGAGKSTLFRCLAGWARPTDGTVEICGARFDGTDAVQRRAIAYVPDVPAFYDDLTAGEHIRFMLQANRAAADEAAVHGVLEPFGLDSFQNQYPSSYSRGMRQKLALSIAFLTAPRLYLLDEPYGPLDWEASRRLSGFLAAERARGAAVLVSCHHDVPDLQPNAVLRLEDGHLTVSRPEGNPDAAGVFGSRPQREPSC